MSERINDKDLDSLLDRINTLMRVNDEYRIMRTREGFKLVRQVVIVTSGSKTGWDENVLDMNYSTKPKLYVALHAFLKGIRAARDLA